MMQAKRADRMPMLWFLLVSLSIIVVDFWVAASSRFAQAPALGALGVTIDLALVMPFAYFMLVVRKGLAQRRSVLLAAVVGTVIASVAIPSGHTSLVSGTRWLLVAAELGLIGYAALRAVRTVRTTRGSGLDERDFFDHLRDQLRALLPVRGIADAIASEAALLYYALFSWGARPHVPAGTLAFTTHRSSGLTTLLFVGIGLSALEIPLVHLLMARWAVWAAWAVSGLGIYGVLWALGCYQSIRLRPTLLLDDVLLVRLGLVSAVRVPLSVIDRIERAHFPYPERNAPDYLRAAVIGDPSLLLHLAEPLQAVRLYGMRKTVSLIGIALDDSATFGTELAARTASRRMPLP